MLDISAISDAGTKAQRFIADRALTNLVSLLEREGDIRLSDAVDQLRR